MSSINFHVGEMKFALNSTEEFVRAAEAAIVDRLASSKGFLVFGIDPGSADSGPSYPPGSILNFWVSPATTTFFVRERRKDVDAEKAQEHFQEITKRLEEDNTFYFLPGEDAGAST